MEEQEDFLEEEQIFFKRFSKEKQEQVRGLVQYATLMGLTGKDLVSIGGKLDRLKEQQERARNIDIIKGFNCLPIGQDANGPIHRRDSHLDARFKLKTPSGDYNFKNQGYSEWDVTSLKTKVTKSINIDYYKYPLGRTLSWSRRSRYTVLLELHNNKFQLNF